MKTKNQANRAEKIKEWESKGAEWCAAKLWEARKNIQKKNIEYKNEHNTISALEAKLEATQQVNRGLEKVLNKTGIKPVPLRINYITHECNQDGLCEDWVDYNCDECPNLRAVHNFSQMAFYTYSIDDDVLNGIDAAFAERHLQVAEIADSRTGEILYKAATKEEEGE